MGVYLSGGIGPLRAAVPLGPVAFWLVIGPFVLLWWMFVYFMYWPMRLMFFDLPRLIIRANQSRTTARS